MANQEHLDKLKEGVKVWNQWREKHKDIQPDLSEANLGGAKLIGVDFSNVNLSGADLTAASLHSASLHSTNLNTASLNGADLSSASLRGADLLYTNIIAANLSETDLSYARLNSTIFAWVDLNTVKGLDTVVHNGPSTIGIDTIYRSQGNIPEIFLRGAGIDDRFIENIRSLSQNPFEYYSCFISYSSKDEAFAKRLYADLQSHNVRCWFAPEDLKWGEKIRTGIDEAIRLHDKLLLILSKSSVASGWVEHEVKAALAKERKEKRVTLFPVRVDKAVLENPLSWATEIRHERNIGDFTRWKTHNEYEKAFTRLLRDLKADSKEVKP